MYYGYTNLGHLLHEDRVTNFEPHTLLQLGPPPSKLSDCYKTAIKVTSLLIHSFTLVLTSGRVVKLPIWVLDYWWEIKQPMEYWSEWKSVLEWLKKVSELGSMAEACDQVMAGLSCFPWNGGNCSVHDMELLLTESYLSDFHVDYTLAKIFHYHSNQFGDKGSNYHTFLTRISVELILKGYKRNTDFVPAAKSTSNPWR